MPKRPSDELSGGRAPKQSSRQQRQHLYLVLDDGELGYSTRKVDLSPAFDSDEVDDGGTIDRTEQRLPQAGFRLEAPHGCSGQFFPFGTKIIYTGIGDSPWGTVPIISFPHVRGSAPRREWETSIYGCAYAETHGKLFLLDGVFDTLQSPPPLLDNGPAADIKVKFDWSWCSLPRPPYHDVISHAVHPDQRTMVFSMSKLKKWTFRHATFSFDLESSRWTRHGTWMLPFKGRGYFDCDLDAWVGLSSDPDTLGHLCACDVLSADSNDGQPPACKLSKEKLFCVDPVEKHNGATLVYVDGGGDRSRFCLVQCLSVDDRQEGVWKESMPECRRHLLRITTFSPKYDKHGDLRVAKCHHVGSYRLPDIASVYYEQLEI
uniref:DUF1618 domain-containing protein n=1 Tax=Leersia perrieri TaxID=77586 RepID=A0A0D9VI06_9ORYZ